MHYRYKDTASHKIEVLQRQLAESVPATNLSAANREFADLTAKYRDLLHKQKDFSLQERRVEEFELLAGNLKRERETLADELRLAKEKLVSLESMMKTMGVSGALADEGSPQVAHQIQSLSQQVRIWTGFRRESGYVLVVT